MLRFVYVSRLSTPAAAVLPSTMEDILLASSRNNARDGVRGFLLCDGVDFAQVLEGERAAVESCMARILSDPRHGDIAVRMNRRFETALFDRWSMCGLTLSPRDDALLTPPDTGYEIRDLPGAALVQVLANVADRYGPELDAQHARRLRQA
jgi:hypothetical protein